MSHLLRTQDVWHGRVTGGEHADLPFWRTDTLDACADRAEASAERWRGLPDETDDFDRRIRMPTRKGRLSRPRFATS